LTSVLGSVLLAGVPVMFLTGFLSFLSYNPWLPGNNTKPFTDLLTTIPFHWPTHPYWAYRVNQGLHVTLGTVLVPVLLAKLWSVVPKLFEWPPVRSDRDSSVQMPAVRDDWSCDGHNQARRSGHLVGCV
jgi:hypothetical protein